MPVADSATLKAFSALVFATSLTSAIEEDKDMPPSFSKNKSITKSVIFFEAELTSLNSCRPPIVAFVRQIPTAPLVVAW